MPRHANPVTEEDDRRVRELHAQGLTRNAIAKKIGRSGRTVSRIADRLGLDFERTRTAAATAAKVVDARARRAALSLALLDDVDQLRQRLNEPCTVYRLSNDGDLLTGVITRPDARDSRDLMTAISLGIEKSLRLEEFDADPGINGAKSMLSALAAGLGAAYDQLTKADTDGD